MQEKKLYILSIIKKYKNIESYQTPHVIFFLKIEHLLILKNLNTQIINVPNLSVIIKSNYNFGVIFYLLNRQKIQTLKFKYFFFLQKSLNEFLTNYFNYKYLIKFLNYKDKKRKANIVAYKTSKKVFIPALIRKLKISFNICYALYISMLYKDVYLFEKTLKGLFKHIHYLSHKKIILFINKIIFKLYTLRKRLSLNISGIQVIYNGKIGIGGSAKKRQHKNQYGQLSLTSKNLPMVSYSSFFWTLSGSLGFQIKMFYKKN